MVAVKPLRAAADGSVAPQTLQPLSQPAAWVSQVLAD